MILVHDTLSKCALLTVFNFVTDIPTDALTVGYLLGTYSVRKSS